MPERPKVFALPPEIRAELDAKFLSNGFSGLVALAEWLESKGYEISKSSLGRYSLTLKRQMAAIQASTQAAKMIADAAPDDEDSRSAAVLSLLQTQVFDVLVNLSEAQEEEDPAARLKILSRASTAAADLARASVSQKRWSASVREKVGAKLKALEAEAAGPRSTLDPETLRRVTEAVYGVL